MQIYFSNNSNRVYVIKNNVTLTSLKKYLCKLLLSVLALPPLVLSKK